jgi:hypothetical protein
MDLFVEPMKDVQVKGNVDLDFRPADAAPKASVRHTEVYQAGKLVQNEDRTAEVSAAERTSLQSVRDALAGTTFLADAHPFAETELALNTTRLVFTGQDGTRQMLDLDAVHPAEAYAPFFAATQDYAKVAWPKQ